MIDKFCENKSYYLSCLLFCCAFGLFVCQAFVWPIDFDEREHFYATYIIGQGDVPYVDFFEHHHPLLWYLFVPLFRGVGETFYMWTYVRIGCCLIALGMYFYLYKLAKMVFSPQLALLCCVFCLATAVGRKIGVQYRPDNLMLFFYLGGLYHIYSYLQNKKILSLQTGVLFFFCGFWALQKMVVFALPTALIILYEIGQKKIYLKDVLKALIIPLVLMAGLIGFMIYTDVWQDYYEQCWAVNKYVVNDLTWDRKYFILPIIGAFAAIYGLGYGSYLVKINSITYLMLSGLFFVILPYLDLSYLYLQYIYAVYPLLSLGIIFACRKIEQYKLVYCVMVICGICFFGYQINKYSISYKESVGDFQYHQMMDRFILNETCPDEAILCDVNYKYGCVLTMRRCVNGFYYFEYDGIAPKHQALFPKHSLPSWDELVLAYTPKVVTNTQWKECVYNEQSRRNDCHVKRSKISSDYMTDKYSYHGYIWVRK